MSGSYKDLRVWQQAMQLGLTIYRVSAEFPNHEVYGLRQQVRKAAVSVASNIAEGKGRRTDKDFLSFLYRARGSLLEVETQAIFARELKYIREEEASEVLHLTAAVGSSLTGLINALQEHDTEFARA